LGRMQKKIESLFFFEEQKTGKKGQSENSPSGGGRGQLSFKENGEVEGVEKQKNWALKKKV